MSACCAFLLRLLHTLGFAAVSPHQRNKKQNRLGTYIGSIGFLIISKVTRVPRIALTELSETTERIIKTTCSTGEAYTHQVESNLSSRYAMERIAMIVYEL